MEKRNHMEYSYDGENKDIAVIFIHGILGSPNQFKKIAVAINNKGISTRCILLPGHGGKCKEFRKCTSIKWYDYVEKQVREYRKKYKTIIIVGHSMGGLLAVNEAVNERVEGIVLLSSPLKVRVTFKEMEICLKILFQKEDKDDTFIKSYREAFSIERGRLYEYIFWVSPYIHLFKMIKYTKNVLHKINVPTLIIQSEGDETVNYRSADNFYDEIESEKKSVILLRESGHSYYEENEMKVIIENVVGFVEKFLTLH